VLELPVLVPPSPDFIRQVSFALLNVIPQGVVCIFDVVVHTHDASEVWPLIGRRGASNKLLLEAAGYGDLLTAPDYAAVVCGDAEIRVDDLVPGDRWVCDDEADGVIKPAG
jgi:hypothetical protein